ncbi:DNA repair protein RecN [Acidovorax sp. HDW3]|uniref:DNA repair protein RecN n=1 Tax=Acidovorax sp. HDW3 TaxID=2714923 RepID=UPI001409A303|nr:DNA repair protein RecN [Acidovorax sp. HDW3]QIL43154.1 DNA repair protein RecN [Acidovorax sp. HDW3]
MALRRIALRDFVIVPTLDIELQSGFTALTGETGAGKSILIDALQLALGARADTAVVREGARQADICAEFDVPPTLIAWLDDGGFEAGPALLLRRVIDLQGKSRAWINGSPATATQLRHLGEQLLDIHGQHAWQSLTRPDAVRDLLDAYAGLSSAPLAPLWTAWRAAQQAQQQAQQQQESLLRERERLQWQIGELDKLSPSAQEWETLNTEHNRLTHAQSLLDTASSALALLEHEDSGAHSPLSRAQHQLAQQAHLDPALTAMAEVLAASLAQLDDTCHSLHAYLRRTELDPQRLATLDARLAQWLALARRYKRQPQDLPALLASWRQELAQLDAAADLAQLQATEQACAQAYQTAALQLSKQRTQAAPRLSRAITEAMQGLGMAGGQFQVQLAPAATPGLQGLDAVEFLVAGHPGASPRPIAKVASGGELSRIALAIAVTTSALGEAGTLIFDEVDAGVGGAVAHTVGRLMQRLGRDRQVLAVTHLPQVAACADQHLVVAKQQGKAGTRSRVTAVAAQARVHEIARMLGGAQLSDATLAHAQEMLTTELGHAT